MLSLVRHQSIQPVQLKHTRSALSSRTCLPRRTSVMAHQCPDGAEYKARVEDMFAKRAVSYDTNNTFHPPLCQHLVDIAGIHEGAHVLDVCTGTGTVALAAAPRAKHVIGVDISPDMLSKAHENAAHADVANVEFVLHDVEHAHFPDGSFDFILCSNGMAYLEDARSATRMFHRWLKPGGKLVFNNPLAPMFQLTESIIDEAARRFGVTLTDAGAILGTENRIQEILTAAGFSSVQVSVTDEEKVWKDHTPQQLAERLFEMMRTFPRTPMSICLTSVQVEELREAYMPGAVEQAATLQRGSDVVTPYKMLWAVATT